MKPLIFKEQSYYTETLLTGLKVFTDSRWLLDPVAFLTFWAAFALWAAST